MVRIQMVGGCRSLRSELHAENWGVLAYLIPERVPFLDQYAGAEVQGRVREALGLDSIGAAGGGGTRLFLERSICPKAALKGPLQAESLPLIKACIQEGLK